MIMMIIILQVSTVDENNEDADIMEENAVSCLPVVTGTYLVGMVTRDSLGALGFEPDRDDPMAQRPQGAGVLVTQLSCVGCGSRRHVARDVRSNLIPMCHKCLGGGAVDGDRKAN